MINRIERKIEDKNKLDALNVDVALLENDFYDYSKVVVQKPWGYEYLIFQNENVAVWILYLKHNAQTSMHCHPNKTTSLVVLQGQVECSTLTDKYQRLAGEGVFIDKGVFHQTRVLSTEGAYVMEIEGPVNKRDLVRLKDQYGREGKGYENSSHYSFNSENFNYLSLKGPEVAHNIKKNFGECSLSIIRINQHNFESKLAEFKELDILCLVKGEIFDQNNNLLVNVTETTNLRNFLSQIKNSPAFSSEVLVIKRDDSLIKASDYVARFFKAKGIRKVFICPGDSNVHLLDSLGKEESIELVTSSSEHNAALAAEGFAKATGELAVLCLSSGASAVNALRGVSNSFVDSTPLLIISGQARSDQCDEGDVRQLGNKGLNVVELVKSITKYAVRLKNAQEIFYQLEKGYHVACEGRKGPVWIDFPIDLQGLEINQEKSFGYRPLGEESSSNIPTEKILACLKEAKRPVILVGNGVRLSGAVNLLPAFLEKLNVPVLLSRRGADLLSEDFSLYAGRPGVYGQRSANFIIQNCDLLISLGSRLSIPQIGRNTEGFARGAFKILVDIDANELQKKTIGGNKLGVVCDARSFIESMTNALAETAYDLNWPEWKEQVKKWQKTFSIAEENYQHKEAINPYLFVEKLAELLPSHTTLVADGGLPMNSLMQTFQFKKNQRLISSTGLELFGFALSASIGVAHGMKKEMTICLCEEKALQKDLHEIQAMVENKLPIKIFVFRTKGHPHVRVAQQDHFAGRLVASHFESDFCQNTVTEIGRSKGIEVLTIEKEHQLSEMIQRTIESKDIVICYINLDLNQEFIPRLGFKIAMNGEWKALPLEDMYPYIDRKTLNENMLIPLLEDSQG